MIDTQIDNKFTISELHLGHPIRRDQTLVLMIAKMLLELVIVRFVKHTARDVVVWTADELLDLVTGLGIVIQFQIVE